MPGLANQKLRVPDLGEVGGTERDVAEAVEGVRGGGNTGTVD